MKLGVIILAAGKGKRMKSDLPKVAHKAGGKPLVAYPVELAVSMGADPVCLVVGHGAEIVKELLSGYPVTYAMQSEQLGTGHAVLQAGEIFSSFKGPVLILYGDVPLISKELVVNLYTEYMNKGVVLSLVSTILENPDGYGRIIREQDKIKIVEDKDTTDEEKKCKEINAGIYIIDSEFLFQSLPKLKADNNQKEYYLTDLIKIASFSGRKISAYIEPDAASLLGVNTLEDLENIEKTLVKQRAFFN